MMREAPYSLRSWVGVANGTFGGQGFTDDDYRMADAIYNDIPGLFNSLQAAGCIEPSGWSADRSVTSWRIAAGFDLVKHEHDLRWNPDGLVACVGADCTLHFSPAGDVDRTEYFDTWPRYSGPVPE
jgi:hypothetical protein